MDPETGLPIAFGKVSAPKPSASANLAKHARTKQVSLQTTRPSSAVARRLALTPYCLSAAERVRLW